MPGFVGSLWMNVWWFRTNEAAKPVQLVEVNLWMTQNVSRTNWHYDTWNNLLGVAKFFFFFHHPLSHIAFLGLVQGRKEVLLCAPNQGYLLNPHPVHASTPNHCRQALPEPGWASFGLNHLFSVL